MSLDIFNVSFPEATLQKLAKHKDKMVIFCTYNTLKIMQVVVCSVTIRDKNIDTLCRFFVVTRGNPVLLGMPDIEITTILGVQCCTIEPGIQTGENNEQRIEGKS